MTDEKDETLSESPDNKVTDNINSENNLEEMGGGNSSHTETGDNGKEAPESTEKSSAGVSADIKTVGRDAKVAQTMTEINNDVRQFFLGDGKILEIKKFSINSAIPILKDNIQPLEKSVILPEDELLNLSSALSSHRMLLLSGNPETGKYVTAKFLSWQMMKKTRREYDVRLVAPLDRGVDIDLMELINNAEALKKKILIFKDVFLKKNQYIIDFFTSSTKEQIVFMSQKLIQHDAFFLFTADTGTFDRDQLEKIDINRELSPLDQDLLEKGFQLKLQYFCSLDPKREFKKASQLLDAKKKQIIETLGRMSKIALFIENYLDQILFEEKTIEAAVEEVHDMKKRICHWFLKELGEKKDQFEAWTFALCLALFNYSSYVDFNDIHWNVTRLLLKKFNSPNFNEDFFFTLSESQLLGKCKARITKDIISRDDIIEFCDPGYQDILLNILMENNRKVLLSLLPFFVEYVEKHHRHNQRRAAAYSIARIGQMGPAVITLPLIREWAKKQDPTHRANVGYLYEGIIASEDEVYQMYCMRFLKNMALSSNIHEQWTAIAAYKQIGLYDLKYAMTELRKIQEEIIERMFEKEDVLDKIYSQTNLLSEEDVLQNLNRFYGETNYLLSTIRYSIIALAILTDPIDVISQLRKWIHKGNRNSKVSVVIFFLGIDGMLQELENREIVYLTGEEDTKKDELRSNILLFSLASGDQAVNNFARFLKDLYMKCFTQYPMDTNNTLKTILFNHLETWVVESLKNQKVSNAVKKLIIQLYQIGNEEFRDTLWNSINHWDAPKKKAAQLKDFVDDITRQIL